MKLRQAAPGDEPLLRQLRLAAMTDAPEAFGSNYERELARTVADWTRWLAPGATFLVEAPEGVAVGLVAAVPDATAPLVHLMAMWVDPVARGTGAADALVEAVVAWTAARGQAVVQLHVEKQNVRARRLYERHGFVVTGHEIAGGRPGFVEVEMTREPPGASAANPGS